MSLPVLASTSSLEELYATAFHGLRAPVSSINGYASVLLTGELGRLAPRQREPLERIQELCRNLTALIGNLLTLAKSGVPRGQSARNFLDIGRLLREAIHSVEGEVQRKKLRLTSRLPKEPIRFWGDFGDLTQVFSNLLFNAVKYTPPKGRIGVLVTSSDKTITVCVSDTGVGIPQEDLPRIFEEFYHVDHPEIGAYPGSGLGLAIVKRVVEAYEGRITVHSRLGQGSRFEVALPVFAESKILEHFLEETWVLPRQKGQTTGLILLQVRAKNGAQKWMGLLEQGLLSQLGKEDRIFHLPGQTLLAILVGADSKGFSIRVDRIKRLVESFAKMRGSRRAFPPWRMAVYLAPKQGAVPREFLQHAKKRLVQAWKGSGREVSWS